MILDCKICQQEFENQPALIRHIKKNHPEVNSYENYCIIHFYENKPPTCKCGCGILLKFESHNNPQFFSEYTKNHWPHKQHTPETKQKIKDSLEKAMLELYGVKNPMELKEFIDKIGDTKEQRHGDRKYNNFEKQMTTMLERYGARYSQQVPEFKEKSLKTNLERYGAKTFTSTDEGKRQVKQTKKEKYNDENYINIEKIKEVKKQKYGYECEFSDKDFRKRYNSKNSKIQLKIANDLESTPFRFKGYEYDIKFGNFLIEVDGKGYHSDTMNNLSLTMMNSIINDFRKTKICANSFELIRVRPEPLKTIKRNITFEDIWEGAYTQDYSFDNNTKFLTREYLIKYIEKKGKNNLEKYWRVCLKFLREFQPEFPNIQTDESIGKIITTIKNYNFDIILNDRTFNNNSSLIGVSFLKSQFKSFWKSSFKNNKTPVEAWQDDKIMERIIKYRIGLNNSGEVFDFTIQQMLKGLSALRLTVSFFKPVLAAAIYKHFIGDRDNPTVFDPCCGFGGRLLGFKSLYPNGAYIGCEPNIETFNELLELSKNFSNVYLYNCKLEDFDIATLPSNVDLTFTSIPYYDLETYSNPVEYSNFDEWQTTFLKKVKSLPNLVVNIPVDLRNCFDVQCTEYFISVNTSHFDKVKRKKFEYILDFRK